jgi:hypothetical protein
VHEVHHHFGQVLCTTGRRSSAVLWDNLGYAPFELSELDNLIDDIEIKNVVMGLQSEKAPGPDGLIGLFHKCCFELIKDDLSKAINDFFNIDPKDFIWLMKPTSFSYQRGKMLTESICLSRSA